MAAAVVYDGAGIGGTLFEGKKFWVAQRVPSRSRWLGLITSNGGQIVLLEKQADIVIADHARKDAVPGSYSWTWIEQSVKKGKLEDLENHRAGPVERTSRPVGSSLPTRIARTPFTAADDRALARWVTDAELKGLSTKGNLIYQQLERCNPRHTFQSWRDRWVKVLQFQPRPTPTSSLAPSPVPEEPSTIRPDPLSNGSTVKPAGASSAKAKPSALELSRSPNPPRNSSKGNPFSEDDRSKLLELYDDILNIEVSRTGEAWKKFAEHNPQHTAQEWFKYWMDDIRPLRTPGFQKSTKRKSQAQSIQGNRGDSPQVSETNAKSSSDASTLEQQADRGHESSRYIELQRERFEHTLAVFAEAQEKEIDFEPTVSGRQIQLFDLWNIVKKPEFDNSEDDGDDTSKWNQVASILGFDNFRDSSAPIELAKLYYWILADFAEARAAYRVCLKDILENGGELTEEQWIDFEYLAPPGYEEESKRVEYQVEEENNDEHEILEIPSSPPQRIWRSEKRGYGVANDSAHERTLLQQPEVTPHKRKRVDKGKGKVLEIPSTPEDLLSFEAQEHKSSPVRGQDLSQGHEEVEVSEEEEGMFAKPVQRRIFSKTRTQASKTVQYEPETQDFQFSNAVEGENGPPQSEHVQEDVLTAAESDAAVARSIREDSSTQSQTDSQREGAEVQEFLDHYIALGYPEEVVRDAMLATTLETGDVATVMEDIMRGVGIPQNIEGVWTAEDDRAVRMIENNQEYARVVLKHGEARCVRRRQFLSDLEMQ